jgi:hypothetical protein
MKPVLAVIIIIATCVLTGCAAPGAGQRYIIGVQTEGGPSSRFKYGYIDRRGKVVIQPQFCSSGDFFEGLALACLIHE